MPRGRHPAVAADRSRECRRPAACRLHRLRSSRQIYVLATAPQVLFTLVVRPNAHVARPSLARLNLSPAVARLAQPSVPCVTAHDGPTGTLGLTLAISGGRHSTDRSTQRQAHSTPLPLTEMSAGRLA